MYETAHGQTPQRFDEIVDIFTSLIGHNYTSEEIEDGIDIEYPVFEGRFRGLVLDPVIQEVVGVGEKAKCEVIGDGYDGIAIIMRSGNPFAKQRYGFFLQPDEKGQTFSVWHAPARKPEKGDWIGSSLLDSERVQLATPELTEALVSSLRAR